MPFTLPPLPYSSDALEPYMDKLTVEIHHGKHHAAYVNNLNKALEQAPELAGKTLEELLAGYCSAVPEAIRTAVRNNGGGHFSHSLYWQVMAPGAGGEPTGKLVAAIDKTFGGFGAFKDKFSAAALGRFGSGWAWLQADDNSHLEVTSTPLHDNPVNEGKHALLVIDVWEHAYYLKYQNRRNEFIAAWWNLVNWKEVSRRFESVSR
jgi:Fe-Mn family superoxide dismutase